MKSSIWHTGPEWITDTRRWPIWETEPLLVNTILDEHAGTEMVPSHVLHTDISTGSLLNLQSVINISDYSSYRRLLRVTALVQRFVKNCKLPHTERIYGTVNANELRCAEKLLLRHCQATEYNDEKISLKSRMCRIPLVDNFVCLSTVTTLFDVVEELITLHYRRLRSSRYCYRKNTTSHG
ncbi:hypothetical protein DPMN_050085 [Dreissena polymorpha]|uniref:Uncharacterized protein n=1 Tax=Dreissena polymorpha TaxID=45954 RepID=A0A9D4HLX5_DREPO|nr:hypothetical protein DPMN_050085 [Dreissena polymorpha]